MDSWRYGVPSCIRIVSSRFPSARVALLEKILLHTMRLDQVWVLDILSQPTFSTTGTCGTVRGVVE